MPNQSLLILPMDDRPCNYDFPRQLGEMYGAKIIIPPKEMLGNIFREGDRKKLNKWLLSKANEISGLILSVDTLAYSGLIPSRKNKESFEEIAKELLVLKEIKKLNPNLQIYACSTIMRISNSNDNQEEKDYWNDYGELIYKYSYLLDKYYLVKEEDYEQFDENSILNPHSADSELNTLRNHIPSEIIQDYLRGRFRNFKINKLMLKWAKEGLLDYLVISADDSSEHGFNVIEKRILNKILDKVPPLKNKIIIYPGTDEALSVLVARFINKKENFSPRFYPRYSKSSKGAFLITMYEGTALKETITNQIRAVGGTVAASSETSDIVLYIHTSDDDQKDQYLNSLHNKHYHHVSDEITETDIINLKRKLEAGRNIALIDVAYANGGDHKLMNKLSHETDLKRLITYSAWNTAGNSIGSALAHSSIRLLTKNKDKKFDEHHYNFLFERFLDDWLYQGFERLQFIHKNKPPYSDEDLSTLKNVIENVGKKFLHLHNGTHLSNGDILESTEIAVHGFPWKRPFETDIKCTVKIKRQ